MRTTSQKHTEKYVLKVVLAEGNEQFFDSILQTNIKQIKENKNDETQQKHKTKKKTLRT